MRVHEFGGSRYAAGAMMHESKNRALRPGREGQEAVVVIDTLEVVRGRLPRRALALLAEWTLAALEE